MRHLWRLTLRFGISPGIVPGMPLIDDRFATISQRARGPGRLLRSGLCFLSDRILSRSGHKVQMRIAILCGDVQ